MFTRQRGYIFRQQYNICFSKCSSFQNGGCLNKLRSLFSFTCKLFLFANCFRLLFANQFCFCLLKKDSRNMLFQQYNVPYIYIKMGCIIMNRLAMWHEWDAFSFRRQKKRVIIALVSCFYLKRRLFFAKT